MSAFLSCQTTPAPNTRLFLSSKPLMSVIRYSTERFFDTATGVSVVVGRHKEDLILIPYEKSDEQLTPVTVHVTSRQQINSRVKSGRFRHE